jgi:hypothetical protein
VAAKAMLMATMQRIEACVCRAVNGGWALAFLSLLMMLRLQSVSAHSRKSEKMKAADVRSLRYAS